MTAKKKTVKRTSSTVLYLHVDAATKRWLHSLCKKQPGYVSQSTMAERIFEAARRTKTFSVTNKTAKATATP